MIRRLTANDAPDMAALHLRAISPSWPLSDMQDHAARDICIGNDQPITGFIILRPASDQGEILTIVTDPAHRQIGIARALLQAGENAARSIDVEILFLEVAEDNEAAIRLYRSSGYAPLGRRPGYYRRENGRVAALTFRKRLDG